MGIIKQRINKKYAKAVLFANFCGGLATFVAAFLFLVSWETNKQPSYLSLMSGAANVAVLFGFVGLVYSFVLVTPLLMFTSHIRLLYLGLGSIIVLLPAITVWGSGYWDILALCYGVTASLVYIKMNRANET
ncbi:hypothetical protein [Glaciecola sp. 1036]|uniref:hypothetical protein n=1 Tax=Alteromonadaceae TaxID=72275 RepID=UPI003D02ECE4